MTQNYYLYEKLAEAHRQDLLREAEQQRLLAGLARQQNKGVRHITGKGILLLILVIVFVAALLTHVIVTADLSLLARYSEANTLRHLVASSAHAQVLSQHLMVMHDHLHGTAVHLAS